METYSKKCPKCQSLESISTIKCEKCGTDLYRVNPAFYNEKGDEIIDKIAFSSLILVNAACFVVIFITHFMMKRDYSLDYNLGGALGTAFAAALVSFVVATVFYLLSSVGKYNDENNLQRFMRIFLWVLPILMMLTMLATCSYRNY